MALAYALCTVQEVKDQLGITVPTYDTVISDFIDRTTVMIETYLGRRVLDRDEDITEKFDILLHQKSILIKNFPINSIVSIEENDVLLTSDQYTQYEEIGKILRKDCYFQRGDRIVEVVYRGGFLTVPFDIKQVCINIVCGQFLTRDSGNIIGESLGDRSITYLQQNSVSNTGANIFIDPYNKAILDRYKNYL